MMPSGLQYKVLRAGTGDGPPLPSTACECHYEGRCAKDYPGGKTFDSSYARGAPTTACGCARMVGNASSMK